MVWKRGAVELCCVVRVEPRFILRLSCFFFLPRQKQRQNKISSQTWFSESSKAVRVIQSAAGV